MLSDVDNEHEDDTEDSLSWDESDPESNEVSDSYSEISASESDSEEEQDGDSREILGKDGYVWSRFFTMGSNLPHGTVNVTFFMVPQQG